MPGILDRLKALDEMSGYSQPEILDAISEIERLLLVNSEMGFRFDELASLVLDETEGDLDLVKFNVREALGLPHL